MRPIDTSAAPAVAKPTPFAVDPQVSLPPQAPAQNPTATPVNKFSAEATAKRLPPPSAPKVAVTQQAIDSYRAMAEDVDAGLTRVAESAATVSDPAASPQGEQQAMAERVERYVSQALHTMQSGDLMKAFLALQVHEQNSGLLTRQTLSSLLSQARQDALQVEIDQDRQAQSAVQKALGKAHQLSKVSNALSVFVFALTGITAVTTVGIGVGLAVVVASMTVGAWHGARKEGDLRGILNDASFAGGIATAVVGIGAALAAMSELAADVGAQGVRATLESAERAAATEAQTAANAAAHRQLAQEATSRASAMAKKFKDAFHFVLQKVTEPDWLVQHTRKELAATGLSPPLRAWKVASLTSFAGRTVGNAVEARLNYQSNRYNMDAQTHRSLGALAEVLAKVMQEEYQDLQNFMLTISQSHNKLVRDALSMLISHFQAQQRAIQNML